MGMDATRISWSDELLKFTLGGTFRLAAVLDDLPLTITSPNQSHGGRSEGLAPSICFIPSSYQRQQKILAARLKLPSLEIAQLKLTFYHDDGYTAADWRPRLTHDRLTPDRLETYCEAGSTLANL